MEVAQSTKRLRLHRVMLWGGVDHSYGAFHLSGNSVDGTSHRLQQPSGNHVNWAFRLYPKRLSEPGRHRLLFAGWILVARVCVLFRISVSHQPLTDPENRDGVSHGPDLCVLIGSVDCLVARHAFNRMNFGCSLLHGRPFCAQTSRPSFNRKERKERREKQKRIVSLCSLRSLWLNEKPLCFPPYVLPG